MTSVRSRQKEALIKDQLRRNLVITSVIRPGYGEVVVYEHEFANPFETEMVGARGVKGSAYAGLGWSQGRVQDAQAG